MHVCMNVCVNLCVCMCVCVCVCVRVCVYVPASWHFVPCGIYKAILTLPFLLVIGRRGPATWPDHPSRPELMGRSVAETC
jgi:hypothetical protein